MVGTAKRVHAGPAEAAAEHRAGADVFKAELTGRAMDLTEKVKTALDETRMLILGSEVLVGFQFQSIFRESFEKLPSLLRYLDGIALVAMVSVVALLIAPAIRHRVVERGRDSGEIYQFISAMAGAALLPFALSLGIDVFIGIAWTAGLAAGALSGAVFAGLALFWWYGFGFMRRSSVGRKERAMSNAQRHETKPTPIDVKIDQMLTEARVILPGAQALLGFQLAVILTESFEKLPTSSRAMHAVSLGLLALTIILLMAPAAYHRLVYAGQDVPEFHRTGSIMVTAATVPLALGLSGDVYVAIAKIAESTTMGIVVAALALAGFLGLWHVYPAVLRTRRRRDAHGQVR